MLLCSTIVILINPPENNDKLEINSREKHAEDTRRNERASVWVMTKQAMTFQLGRDGWKGILYCINHLVYCLWGWFGVRIHLCFVFKEEKSEWRTSAETIRQKIHIFTWRYTHLLTKGQFYAARGDVLDPTYLLPVTLGAGGGEMDHPSVTTISPATCRVRDLEHYFFAGRFQFALRQSIPSCLQNSGVSSCCMLLQNKM